MWLDMRHEKRIHPLKGTAGSVRAIGQHPDHANHVAAVGLDRHLYVFDVKTNQRKQKVLVIKLLVVKHVNSVLQF